jgi:hypothetical protein
MSNIGTSTNYSPIVIENKGETKRVSEKDSLNTNTPKISKIT